MKTIPYKGLRFLHSKWLDAARMPEKHPQLMEVTKVASGAVYYRPVYNYGDREELGKVIRCYMHEFGGMVVQS